MLGVSLANLMHAQIYVDQTATGDNNGTSWDNAYVDLQDALTNANPNDEIWVAQGRYVPPQAGRFASFITQPSQIGLKIYGGFNGIETALNQRDFRNNPTVLDGDKNGDDTPGVIDANNAFRQDNVYNVVLIQGDDVTIDGFTIENGHANGNDLPQQNGAAIRKTQAPAKLTVKNCLITNNYANTSAAGIFFWVDKVGSELIAEGNVFTNNRAQWGTGIYAVLLDPNPTATMDVRVLGNLFAKNEAIGGNSLGASALWVRGLATQGIVDVDIINNTIYNNVDNVLSNQGETRTTVGVDAVGTSTISTTYANNINDNNADLSGTVASNNIMTVLSGTYLGNEADVFINNNLTDVSFGGAADIPPASLANNILGNPSYVDEANNDLNLVQGSLGIDAGDNTSLPAGFTSDLAGNPRIVNTTVDAGAFEFQGNLSVSSLNKENFKLSFYPNPATDVLTINAENKKLTEISIFSLQGRKILQSKNNTVDVSKLQAGIYLVKAVSQEGIIMTKRFIKK
ncbi:hypothetical protein GCM10009117_19770 [Gangjinia marincola]|uniref:Secretion system C-terminal sorting domain-containing protein n=2 Tax=Gangjinia marincola TaxID=578463 RepID=A0ABP3XUB6_9FLAO